MIEGILIDDTLVGNIFLLATSSNWKSTEYLTCIEKTKIKEKEAGMDQTDSWKRQNSSKIAQF